MCRAMLAFTNRLSTYATSTNVKNSIRQISRLKLTTILTSINTSYPYSVKVVHAQTQYLSGELGM